MSGTSVDGVDACLARIVGSGRAVSIEVKGKYELPYSSELRDTILRNSNPETSNVHEISQLNVRLAHEYKRAIDALLKTASTTYDEIDLIGSHGQTIYHVPEPGDCAGEDTTSTLQIGDPSTLAKLTGVPVVGDFRLADMALGGQGAPLVPYLDVALFGHQTENRVLLNLGGIANVTLVPAANVAGSVIAFDTGPSNMISDLLCQELLSERYDAGGERALAGTANTRVVDEYLSDEYFALAPPKSTGREFFGSDYMHRFLTSLRSAGTSTTEDILASACLLTVESVVLGIDTFLRPRHQIDRLIAAGGGIHNKAIMSGIAERISPTPLEVTGDYGMDPDVKEAVCFALFAHETMNGVASNVPSVTGAARPAIMGKICLPD